MMMGGPMGGPMGMGPRPGMGGPMMMNAGMRPMVSCFLTSESFIETFPSCSELQYPSIFNFVLFQGGPQMGGPPMNIVSRTVIGMPQPGMQGLFSIIHSVVLQFLLF